MYMPRFNADVQKQMPTRSKGHEEIQERESTKHLSDRYRPHRFQPQGWRDSLGETVEDATLRRWPVPAQFLYGQALPGHQCHVALVERLQQPVLADLQTGAGVERPRPQRRERNPHRLL